MVNTVIVGAQWGDEGKGAQVDKEARDHKVVVRFQGGPNAGHTVIDDQGEKYVLHQLPSGILTKGTINILGNNVVIDPTLLRQEIRDLQQRGIEINPDNLMIGNAGIIMGYNLAIEGARETVGATGLIQIGTTKKAIGPTYADKCERIGLDMADLHYLSKNDLEEKIKKNLAFKNHVLKFYGANPVSLESVMDPLLAERDFLNSFFSEGVRDALFAHNGAILAEGAQGALLDKDHGTYPDVTSSNTILGGFYTSLGVAPGENGINFDRIIGIVKAYTTRVGLGPFPTKLTGMSGDDGKIGTRLQEKGKEFGATTGRRRDCGWLDLPLLEYAFKLNGITEFVLTKLDVLNGESVIKVAVSHEIGGRGVKYPMNILGLVKPVYERFDGWNEDISSVRKIHNLPDNALAYLNFLQNRLDVPISAIRVGPRRDQIATW
ncbi:MAG: adenylosuccinate synthase [Candidatus Pacearchaeota archaeon]|nr:adenylosuccinate synthase [Candidatus Pacearchaeota archaeon]